MPPTIAPVTPPTAAPIGPPTIAPPIAPVAAPAAAPASFCAWAVSGMATMRAAHAVKSDLRIVESPLFDPCRKNASQTRQFLRIPPLRESMAIARLFRRSAHARVIGARHDDRLAA